MRNRYSKTVNGDKGHRDSVCQADSVKVDPLIESERSEGDNVKRTCELHEVSKPPTTHAREAASPPRVNAPTAPERLTVESVWACKRSRPSTHRGMLG